jgi:carbon storage regulator
MLVLTRRASERIRIDDDVVVTVVQVKGRRVRIGVEAPHDVRIVREELHAACGSPPSAGSRPRRAHSAA